MGVVPPPSPRSFTYRLGGRGGEERGDVTKKSEGGWEIGGDLDKGLKMKKAAKGTEEGREKSKKKQRKDEGGRRGGRETQNTCEVKGEFKPKSIEQLMCIDLLPLLLLFRD